jgi:acylphosphatase
MSERLAARVVGYVQGVGFRYFVRRAATRLGLTGWVANESDGSVMVVVEGEPAALDRLCELLIEGPPGARVKEVRQSRTHATGEFGSFEVHARAHPGD